MCVNNQILYISLLVNSILQKFAFLLEKAQYFFLQLQNTTVDQSLLFQLWEGSEKYLFYSI